MVAVLILLLLSTVFTLLIIYTLLSVWPQILVHITADTFSCDATREETACMPQPSPVLISCNVVTRCVHSMEQGRLILSMMLIHSPPSSREKLLYRIEERRVRW